MARTGTLWLILIVFFISKTNAGLPEVHLNKEAAFADPQGRLLLFHGFNSVYKQPPYFNAKDVSDTRLNFFQQWGFNVVRLGVLWHPTFPLGPGDLNDTYLKAIEWQVDRFANAGIYVILDMHQDSLSTMFGSYDAVPLWLLKSFPKPPGIFKYPWPRKKLPSGDWEGYTTYACQMAFQHIYNNQTNAWEHWGNFWVQVANRFKNRSNVLGYELMNEPFAGNIYTNPLRAIPGYAGKHNLAPVYDYLVRRIRSVDKQKFIFFEGVTWSVLATSKHDGLAGPGFERVPGGSADPQEFQKSVFSYHYYCPLIELANGSLNFSPYTRLICDDIIMPRMFSSVKGIARGLKSGRFLTEFGICAPDGNPDSINTIECNAVMNAADAQLQSWTYWDARFFDEKGNPVIDLVKSFARVYPMMTAGEPISLVFDVKTGSAFYAFSSTRLTMDLARKKEPIASIFIPIEIHYQNGYKFEVNPISIWYNVSLHNSNLFYLYAPSSGLTEGVIIEVNINTQ
ncbi:Endoglycoceramidase [Echinococcus granulosus]|uniref:Glycoside hydrolase subgroup catalytic core n=1 Tax=Echinococcus granulosus TaxID=6210 RepID=A0A068WPN5_ECHGR|nr:Endoglycoceramidase [Echinococcus granulosus]CDS22089.1 glycoside hydrolase subgroup catalytic core [Echinococcus granulosus]